MKTKILIAFVFISVFATAQEFKGLRVGDINFTPDSTLKTGDYGSKITFAIQDAIPVLTVDRDSSRVVLYGAELLTFKLLMKYKQECYDDSTFLQHQHYLPKGEIFCMVDYECLIGSHYRSYWIRKEPTFSDFLNWLEKQ